MQPTRGNAERTLKIVPAYVDAARSGHFFTRWSALVSFVAAGLLLVPLGADRGIAGYAQGMAASVLAWAILAVPVLAVAAIERRTTDRTLRGILITCTLLGLAVVRPFLNEAMFVALLQQHSTGTWAARIITNVIVVFALFSLVAIITTEQYRVRVTARRLNRALGQLDAVARQDESDEAGARVLIAAAVAELRVARDDLLTRPIDFMSVRAFSDLVRAASHRFDVLAETRRPEPTAWAARSTAVTHRRGGVRLVPTPLLWVGALYALMCVPFVATSGNTLAAIVAVVVIVLIDLAVAAILRLLPVWSARMQALVFIAAWVLAGLVATWAGHLLLPLSGPLMLLPTVALPVVAVVLAAAIDAHRRAHDDEQRATRELARAAAAFADRPLPARRALSRAASTLHGRVQGRCVIFAARADEHVPTPADIAQFRSLTDAALDEVLHPTEAAPTERSGELSRMLAGWEPLLDLDARVDDDAAVAFELPDVALSVSEIINEALVNAVKHSGARAAQIDVTVGDARALRVRVRSLGILPRAVMQTRPFAGSTRLYQDGADVVLEATVPTPVRGVRA